MYTTLQEINAIPKPFEYYTADKLWCDPHVAKMMLAYHLNDSIEAASRNSGFIDRSVAWIKSEFSIGTGIRVIDFGCAVGWYTAALAKTGADVTGLDFSQNSLDYAKKYADKHELNIDYQCMNYLDFQASSLYNLVIMIMCDYCALSPMQRKRLLTVFYDSLVDGGFVLLDVFSLRRYAEIVEVATVAHNHLAGFWSENDYYAFINTFKYDAEKVTLDKYTIYEQACSKVVYNWLQHFSRETVEQEFKEAGFAIKSFYANVAGDKYDAASHEFALVAIKQ